jgi:hypothetical protein
VIIFLPSITPPYSVRCRGRYRWLLAQIDPGLEHFRRISSHAAALGDGPMAIGARPTDAGTDSQWRSRDDPTLLSKSSTPRQSNAVRSNDSADAGMRILSCRNRTGPARIDGTLRLKADLATRRHAVGAGRDERAVGYEIDLDHRPSAGVNFRQGSLAGIGLQNPVDMTTRRRMSKWPKRRGR